MNFKLLNIRHKNQWMDYLNLLPEGLQDVYFFPEFYELFEKKGHGKAHCFVYEHADKFVLYPFLLNCINDAGFALDKKYYDIQGPYGYNGPVSNSKDAGFIRDFSDSFCRFCHEQNIVAEFIRFNPVLKNQMFQNHIVPVEQLDSVLIDTGRDEDYIWNESFDRGVRKAVRKAEKSGITVRIFHSHDIDGKKIDDFISIYHATMRRNDAKEYYFFSRDFFKELIQTHQNRVLLVFAYKDGSPVSTELVTYWKKNSYGFAGGTLAEYYEYSPNSYLRFELIRHLMKEGISNYSIGGGYQRDDTIYKFKKSFSRNVDSRFFIGKKVHNQSVYDELVRVWERNNSEKKDAYRNFLLKYRE